MAIPKKNLLIGALTVIIVYVATLWQRPLFAPDEFNFAFLSMTSDKLFTPVFNGIFGRALGFNIVSVRIIPALSAIICALCVRHIVRREYGEGFGNISAVIYLSTLQVFAYGTACSKEMINAMFLCTAMTAAFEALEMREKVPEFCRYLYAAAGGAAAGMFALSMGFDSLFFPFCAVSFYAIWSRPQKCKSVVATGFAAVAVIFFLWLLDHPPVLFTKYVKFQKSNIHYLLIGMLPWGLFIPQAVCGFWKDKKQFLQKKIIRLSLAVITTGLLACPVTGILPTAVMTGPFWAILFVSALYESQNNEKAVKTSVIIMKTAVWLLLLYTATVVILCCIPRVPANWKLYTSKAELAGFAVACIVALIQFKCAIDEQPHNKAKKILHIATGAAVLMILLPGAIPSKTLLHYSPETFFAGTAARYIAPDTVIYADWNCAGAARWVFRDRKVILINKRTTKGLAKRIKKQQNTAIFSTSRKFTTLIPSKNKMLFVRGRWRIVLSQKQGK